MPNTSVIESLKVAGLYRESGRMAEQTLKTVLPDGQITEHLMAEIDYYDLKTFGDEMEVKLANENPIIQALYAKNAVAIANAIRVVNVRSASGFKGTVGSGRQLDVEMLRPEQFQDPDLPAAAPCRRVTWDRAINTLASLIYPYVGTPQNFIIDNTAAYAILPAAVVPLTMALTEALLIFAFADPAAQPALTAFQLTYLARAYNIQNVDFDQIQAFSGTPLFELKEPFIIYPNESGSVQVEYNRDVTDEMRPIGLWIKMSQNLRALGGAVGGDTVILS